MDITVHTRQRRLSRITGVHWTVSLPTVTRPKRWSRTLIWGITLAAAIGLLAAFSESIAPYDIAKLAPADRLQGPSTQHFFGTDIYGRDLFSRVLVGARLSLTVAGIAVGLAALPGIFLGIVSGMNPGWLSNSFSRVMDAWMAVPGLLLAIAFTAAFGRSTFVLAVALGLIGIPTYYRQARAETLGVQNELYVESARSLGAKEFHILLRHVLPNVLPTLTVLITLRVGSILLAVSGLSFIGLGAQPPEPEWGALLAEGRDYAQQAWWLTFFPGAAIAFTVFALNLLGDGLRDLLDPNLQVK